MMIEKLFDFYVLIITVSNRSRFIPIPRHFARRHAEQRRRVSNVISQPPLRRH